MRAWIDIDNPPQVQYLCPFVQHLLAAGRTPPLVTVRDYGSTTDLVASRGLEHRVMGSSAGAGKLEKALKTGGRSLQLARHVLAQGERPRYVISSSRSSALAARLLGLPAFVFCDYEHAELGIYRRLGSHILYPEVIGEGFFRDLGFAPERLLPFPGLKEDISFSFVDIAGTAPLEFPADGDPVKVLLRPPATLSHYYRGASGSLYDDILHRLRRREDVLVILSPRYPEQATAALALDWVRSPVVLDNTADFVSLLKGVDVVVSSGGTMLREAAYLGAHACSIFMGPKGAVDVHLESLGLLTYARDLAAFDTCPLVRKSGGGGLVPKRDLVERIVASIEDKVGA